MKNFKKNTLNVLPDKSPEASGLIDPTQLTVDATEYHDSKRKNDPHKNKTKMNPIRIFIDGLIQNRKMLENKKIKKISLKNSRYKYNVSE